MKHTFLGEVENLFFPDSEIFWKEGANLK